MKILRFFLIAFNILFFSRCITSQTTIPIKGVTFYGYDLTKYSSQGFLITPHEYQGKYLVTGIFTSELKPEIRWERSQRLIKSKAENYKAPEGFDKILIGTGNASENKEELYYILFIEKIAADQAIQKAFEFVQSSGGDGIMDFQISKTTQLGYIEGKQYEYPTIKINGVGIKRQN